MTEPANDYDANLTSDEPIPEVTAEEFHQGFGESLSDTLNLDTWKAGEDLANLYARLEAEVSDAVTREDAMRTTLREHVLPQIGAYPGAPKCAGVFTASTSSLERIHRDLLFPGRVEACDGTRATYDTLPLTIYQIGVSLVSYRGSQGSLGYRLYRRDLRVANNDPVAEMTDLLKRRAQRGGLNQPSRQDTLSELAGRGIMAYAERAMLLDRSSAPWRMGHGNPAPYELVTGSGSLDLMIEATRLIRRLVEEHQRFIFVASEPSDRLLRTIGQALDPLEFAIVGTLREVVKPIVDKGHYRGKVPANAIWDGQHLDGRRWIERFRDTIAPKIVVGVYRASAMATPQTFYAHEDHAEMAAHIALADSVLQEHRGFPLLIDLADSICLRNFGGDALVGPTSAAYAAADAPFRFLSERASRRM